MENYQADFTKCGKDILIDLINYANRNCMTTTLKSDTTVFSDPVALTEDENCNTVIKLREVEGFDINCMSESIYYNRLDIKQLATVMGYDFKLTLNYKDGRTVKTTHDILEDLYKVFKVKLLPEDVILEPLDLDMFKSYDEYVTAVRKGKFNVPAKGIYFYEYPKVTLKISDISVGYLGELELNILPAKIDISNAVKHTRLPSFMPFSTKGLG